MTDQCDNALVDHLLRDQRSVFWIGFVIACHEVKLHGLVAKFDAAGGIDLFNGESRTVFVVLAQVRNGAGNRTTVADLDHIRTRRLGGGWGGGGSWSRCLRCRGFLPVAG